MKCRIINSFVEEESVPAILATIDEILPRFWTYPHYLGAFALRSEIGPRPEIVTITLWDDGLEGSEELANEYRDEILRRTGMKPGRQAFDILRAEVRDLDGTIRTHLKRDTVDEGEG